MLALVLAANLHQHMANLAGVSPQTLPVGGGGPKLQLLGDSAGGLLAGSTWAGKAGTPPNLTLCCDFNGVGSAPIGGESVASMVSATQGSCPVPKVNSAGGATVRLFLSNSPTCHQPMTTEKWLTGQVVVQFSAASVLSFLSTVRPTITSAHSLHWLP